MCRLGAYLGPELALHEFLRAPVHSLIHQAWAPREMKSAALNADGFGVGWYDQAGQPAVYRHFLPAWADPNLDALGRSLHRGLWMANVRSATEGFGTGFANTQPFADRRLMFLHNGYLSEFPLAARPRIRRWLAPEIESEVHGNTDSEYLFACLRQLCAVDALAPLAALGRLAELAEEWGEGRPALLTVVFTEGESLYALRHAVGLDCPTLYRTGEAPAFPGASLLASEPLDDSGAWEPLPDHHLARLTPGRPAEICPL